MARKNREDRGLRPRSLSDGTTVWDIRISHNGPIVVMGGFATKKSARETLEKIRVEQREGTFDPANYQRHHQNSKHQQGPCRITFASFSDLVREKYWATYKPSTRNEYTNVLRYCLSPHLGDFYLDAISEDDIEEMIASWNDEDVKPITITGYLSVLETIFEIARAKGHMSSNPITIARKTIDRVRRFKAKPLSLDAEKQLLSTLATHFASYLCLFLLLLRTGMRVGEALALKISNVNLEARTITIERTWTSGILDTPKYESARVVAIADDLLQALTKHIPSIRQEELERWLPTTELLFPGASRLKPLNLGSLRKNIWKPLFQLTGLPYARIHDLRHTLATTMLLEGAPLHSVSAWLGHKSVATTIDTYVHLLPKDYLWIVTFLARRGQSGQNAASCPVCKRPMKLEHLTTAFTSPVATALLAALLVLMH